MAPFRQQFSHQDETPDTEEVRPERAFGGVATGTPDSAADRGAAMRAAMLAEMDGQDGEENDPAAPPAPA